MLFRYVLKTSNNMAQRHIINSINNQFQIIKTNHYTFLKPYFRWWWLLIIFDTFIISFHVWEMYVINICFVSFTENKINIHLSVKVATYLKYSHGLLFSGMWRSIIWQLFTKQHSYHFTANNNLMLNMRLSQWCLNGMIFCVVMLCSLEKASSKIHGVTGQKTAFSVVSMRT